MAAFTTNHWHLQRLIHGAINMTILVIHNASFTKQVQSACEMLEVIWNTHLLTAISMDGLQGLHRSLGLAVRSLLVILSILA
jgi:hypothetical protein